MKTIQGMIAQFFITHFRNETKVLPIKFVSSSNKLKGFIEGKTMMNAKKVQVTIELINNNSENKEKWLELFKKHSKKDDLADSYLQALWYSDYS